MKLLLSNIFFLDMVHILTFFYKEYSITQLIPLEYFMNIEFILELEFIIFVTTGAVISLDDLCDARYVQGV